MESTIGALAQLGPVGIVLIILIVVGYQWRQSSKGYSTELARVTEWYKGELDRIDKDRDDGFKSLRDEISALKVEVKILRQELEAERVARRAAEEREHELRTRNTL